jgi:hypothetical protein
MTTATRPQVIEWRVAGSMGFPIKKGDVTCAG